MALKLYHDSDTTSEITGGNPDEAIDAVASGGTITDEKAIYMESDDSDLTYENIEIEKGSDNGPSVTLEYAPDEEGSAGAYVSKYEPANGAYTTAHKFWRKVTITNVTEAFKREDITHDVTADEHVA